MNQTPFHHRFLNLLRVADGNWFDRLLVPLLILLAMIYTASRMMVGDWVQVGVSLGGIGLMIVLATVEPLKKLILRQSFTRSHAFFIAVFWTYSIAGVFVMRLLLDTPAQGKASQSYYIYLVLLVAIVFRVLVSLFALTPIGYRLCMSGVPFWEQVLVAINEFVAAGLLAFILGGELARIVQPNVFTLRIDIWYSFGLLAAAVSYYGLVQMMWIQRWNEWLSKRTVWLQLARIFSLFALVLGTAVILRHFANLSEPRSADLLGTANVDQTILALSPIVWMMIFFVTLVVFTSNQGLRRLLLPDNLLKLLPESAYNLLRTVADMDIVMLFGALAAIIPLQLFVFDNATALGSLQQELAQQNALIDSSEQALALIFGLPFYVLAVGTMALYAYVMANPRVDADTRDDLVEKLPFNLLMMFIVTLYLAAVPFSQVLSGGKLPRLPQDLGYILAFDVLIPLIIFFAHYFILIRIPYGMGQSRWQTRHTRELTVGLDDSNRQLERLTSRIQQAEKIWRDRENLSLDHAEKMEMLYELIELNGQRDALNMERTQILAAQQELKQISDEPVALAIASLPRRVLTYGITLVLFFKIYEWAIVNDGLREVANNPNIGILEFFQTILENTNF